MTEDEYTPTTDDVRNEYTRYGVYPADEFNRWLETEREAVHREKRPELDAHKLASLIWETSRADEGTISATGALIIAHAIINQRAELYG